MITMKIIVVCLVVIIFCDVFDCGTPFTEELKSDKKFLREMGAKEDYIQKFYQDFLRINKLYCDPKNRNEAKIKAVGDCYVEESPAEQKCWDQVYNGLNSMKIRDIHCEGGRAQRQIDQKFNLCLEKELGDDGKNNRNNKDPANRPQLDSKIKSEILDKHMKAIDELRECYEKALS